MTKRWIIQISGAADKQFGKLDNLVQKRIRKFLEEKLCKIDNPRQLGHQLTGNLSHFWRYRVGEYRVLCSIKDRELVVLVVHVGHRREVYH